MFFPLLEACEKHYAFMPVDMLAVVCRRMAGSNIRDKLPQALLSMFSDIAKDIRHELDNIP
jgi:hypothetical protein